MAHWNGGCHPLPSDARYVADIGRDAVVSPKQAASNEVDASASFLVKFMNAIIYPSKPPPQFDIQAGGKRYHFEWHPYCGPVVLDKRGDPHSIQPLKFLEAASLWVKQGNRIEDGLCRWDHERKPIWKHISGRNYEFVGYHPAVKGA